MKKSNVWMILTVVSLFSSARNGYAEEKKSEGAHGSLDATVISEYINRAMPMYLSCYKDGVKEAKTSLAGKLEIKFLIGGDGKVAKASVSNTTLNNATIEGCVVDAIKGLQFPEPASHGSVDVTYPFSFGPEQPEKKSAEKSAKKTKGTKK